MKSYAALDSSGLRKRVSKFREILADNKPNEIILKETAGGARKSESRLVLSNFRSEFFAIKDDEDYRFRKAICEDYIFRCALPVFEMMSPKPETTETMLELMFDSKNGFDHLLMQHVTIPMMSRTNAGMPYVTRCGDVELMIDPEETLGNVNMSSSDERGDHQLQCKQEARKKAHEQVKNMLRNRIEQFGISDPLTLKKIVILEKPVSAQSTDDVSDVVPPPRKKKAETNVTASVDIVPSVLPVPQSENLEQKSQALEQHHKVLKPSKAEELRTETPVLQRVIKNTRKHRKDTKPLVTTMEAFKEEEGPSEENNHLRSPWTIAAIMLGAIIGSALGAFVGIYIGVPLLVGVLAITVPAAIGFGVGAFFGWAAAKLIQSCCGHAEQPGVPIMKQEVPTKDLVANPTPRFNSLYCQLGKEQKLDSQNSEVTKSIVLSPVLPLPSKDLPSLPSFSRGLR